jgi:hypothetical protein
MKEYQKPTNMLSGFISQWRTPQFLRCFRAIKSCFAYALTAVSLRPILRPNFFKTSRRFIWRDSKTKQRWFLYLKLERNRTQWRLSSGSAPTSFFNMTSSSIPALYLCHIGRGNSKCQDNETWQWMSIMKKITISTQASGQENRNSHCVITTYNFYCHFFRFTITSLKVLCTNYSRKYTFTMSSNNFISAIKYFTKPVACISISGLREKSKRK